MTTTRAVVLEAFGGPEVLTFRDVELPPPGPREVQIEQTAIGVNFVDIYFRTGLYPSPLPARLGSEAAGVVVARGADVDDIAVGDRVAYCQAGQGAYAEARNVLADRVVRLPDGIDDVTAASSLLKGMTVEYLVERTHRVERDEVVVFHAAAGGVGLIACQWLRAIGARAIGVVSSEEKAAIARAHGAWETIAVPRGEAGPDYSILPRRVRELTEGRGVRVVYDSVGKDSIAASLDCLAPRGLLVSFGNASGAPAPLQLLSLSQKGSLYVTRPTLATYVASKADHQASAAALFAKLLGGDVRVDRGPRMTLAELPEAHRLLESGRTTGAIVLRSA